MTFSIIGTGMYVPPNVVTNDDLSKTLDTSDEWIRQRVGVVRRHLSTSETTADLAYEAARRALENSGTSPEELDLIIAASVSSDYAFPALACVVQQRLGAKCFAYDINSACSAFVVLLETAAGYFARGKAKKALVIGAERLSKLLDWQDRGTCVIFGDGAGAAVLSLGEGYIDSTLSSHGDTQVLRCPHVPGHSPFSAIEAENPSIYMQGQETFKYAVNAMCADIKKLMENNNITADDIAYIIPHQANKRIIDLACLRLRIPIKKFYLNIQEYGNTSSASIPIALDELNRKGLLKRGDNLIFSAFGAGETNAACLLKWKL